MAIAGVYSAKGRSDESVLIFNRQPIDKGTRAPCYPATPPPFLAAPLSPADFPSCWALFVGLNARQRPRERAKVLHCLGVFGRYIVPCWSRRASGTSWLDLQEGPTGTEPKQETP